MFTSVIIRIKYGIIIKLIIYVSSLKEFIFWEIKGEGVAFVEWALGTFGCEVKHGVRGELVIPSISYNTGEFELVSNEN